MQRLKSDDEILSLETRKRIIEEIKGGENKARKDRAHKRYVAYKDQTRRLVEEQLMMQFDLQTVIEMSYAIANLSIVRKIVRKLARVYSNGVKREIPTDVTGTKTLQELEGILCINEEMKRTNRALRLQHNTMLYLRPCPNQDGKYWIKPECLQPYLYDVIESYYDRTKPMVVILSDYDSRNIGYTTNNPALEARHAATPPIAQEKSDGKDQRIADPDVKTKEYVWWSDKWHFTTDEEGKIISQPVDQTKGKELSNPIGMLPLVNFAIDQDGKFWAEGGDDLVDGGVLTNSMISQINHISVIQGYGQFWMKGKGLPTNLKVGPSKMIRLEWVEKEDPEPSLGFASANPDLASLQGLVEFYVAMLLTTNNLSTSGVSGSLKGGSEFPSGIAMMIDKAESVEDVQDQEQIFKDKEPEVWKIISRWTDVYGDSLADELKGKQLPEKFGIELKFNPPSSIMTESEKLDNLQKRKDLGINTLVDIVMMDNPGLTKEEAEKKILDIAEERAKRMASAMITQTGEEPTVPSKDEDESNQDDDDKSEDDSGA